MSPVKVATELAESWTTLPTATQLRRSIRCPIARAAAVTRLQLRLAGGALRSAGRRRSLPSDLAALRRRDLRRARCLRNPATGTRYLLADLAAEIDLSVGRISWLIGAERTS
jgi:hypothetical protein